jgi:hypothetical protein
MAIILICPFLDVFIVRGVYHARVFLIYYLMAYILLCKNNNKVNKV